MSNLNSHDAWSKKLQGLKGTKDGPIWAFPAQIQREKNPTKHRAMGDVMRPTQV